MKQFNLCSLANDDECKNLAEMFITYGYSISFDPWIQPLMTLCYFICEQVISDFLLYQPAL